MKLDVRRALCALAIAATGMAAPACNPSVAPSNTPTPGTVDPSAVETDQQIAAATVAANRGEIEVGQLALANAVSAQVRTFAQVMVSDHTLMLQLQTALLVPRGIEPEANAVSAQFDDEADETLAALRPLRGATFDAAYMNSQVRAHQAVLSMLDTALIPNADTDDFRALLEAARESVAMHLREAQSILVQLSVPTTPVTIPAVSTVPGPATDTTE